MIGTQHISKVQQVVKERLEELESELKDQKQRDLEHVRMDIEVKRATAELDMEQLRMPARRPDLAGTRRELAHAR